MAERCTSEQLAEAVILWSIQVFGTPILCVEREDADDLKPLNLLLSTMEVFSEGFDGKAEIAYNINKQQFLLSKQFFIDYLKPRCLLLAHNNDCFDLMLTCSYVYCIVCNISCDGCFHLARVASKVLATVLEDKFSNMFNTELGWERLISYCRKIHTLVFPSKDNRPPGFVIVNSVPADGDSQNKDNFAGWKESELNKKLEEGKLIRQKETLEFSEVENDTEFCGQIVSSKTSERKSNSSFVVVDSPDAENSDDKTAYWYFEDISNWIICKRITENPKHLKEVLNLFEFIEQKMDPELVSSNKYDITISDDEDIEKLEKKVNKPNMSNWMVELSDGTLVDFATLKICRKRNEGLEDSSPNRVRFEDITDEERLKFSEEYFVPEEEPLCELCHGRKRVFYLNWLKSFREKYTNWDFVSDCVLFLNQMS